MTLVSSYAHRCLHFGMLAGIVLLLVACGTGGSPTPPGPGTNQQPPAQTSAATPTVATGTITEIPNKEAGSPVVLGSDGNLWYPSNDIGRMTPSGTTTQFQTPTFGSIIGGITLGPDGNIWFTESDRNKIGVITPVGKVTEYPLPADDNAPNSNVNNIVSGPDGTLWFRELRNRIGRITTKGIITEFPTNTFWTRGISAGPDGNIWFTTHESVNKMTPDGQVTTYPLAQESSDVEMTLGPDKAVWFTNGGRGSIVRIAPDGTMTSFNVPRTYNAASSLITGPDGNLWMTIDTDIVRMTTKGEFTKYPLPNNEQISSLVPGHGGLWFYDPNNKAIGFVVIAKT